VAADPLAAPCAGDWCLLRPWQDGPVTIDVLLPRRTCLVRAEASGGSRGHAIAANVDVVALVVGLHPEPNLARVERLLALAWESGGRPAVVLTKADLVSDADLVAEDVARVAAGAPVIWCSAVTRVGVDDVRSLLTNDASVALLGASGHGKSTLANVLVGAEVLTTRAIRDDGKGRHTSVRRELLVVPSGGTVIDTPGLRGVGLPQGGGGGVAAAFADVELLAERCRFHDCGHAGEPGCAVVAAVESGALPARRLDSWRRLEVEQRRMAARSDERMRSGQRGRVKYLSKQQRRLHRT
jgi:ribosome biogenesis GTPase / thiamine phosphate phosphatase